MKETNEKQSYSTPMVEVMSARVEGGMQASGNLNNSEGATTSQYGTGSWDSPSPSGTTRFS